MCQGGRHYLKHYGIDHTYAFRFDSLLSQLSVMRGYKDNFEEERYPLLLGRLCPAACTDESVRGGVCFYGSLCMCPKQGNGKWLPYNRVMMSPRMASVCGSAVISIVQVTDVKAGPGGSDPQWSKSGTRPECARVVGSIITEAFAESLFEALPRKDEELATLAPEFLQVLNETKKFAS